MAGDGDITVSLGPVAADDPDLLVWDIVDVDAYEGPSYLGNLVLSIQGDDFVDALGNVTCHRIAYDDGSLLQEIQTADGAVLFTVKQKWVFYGRTDVANPNFGQLAYTLKGDHIYEGSHTDSEPLLTASANIEQASDMRKLMLAVLIDGQCGAPGL